MFLLLFLLFFYIKSISAPRPAFGTTSARRMSYVNGLSSSEIAFRIQHSVPLNVSPGLKPRDKAEERSSKPRTISQPRPRPRPQSVTCNTDISPWQYEKESNGSEIQSSIVQKRNSQAIPPVRI